MTLRSVLVSISLAVTAGAFAINAPKVALLPIQHLSGEKWEELKRKQIDKGHQFLASEFKARGFEVVSADAIKQALENSEIDLTDEENHKRAVLFELGKKLDVDYIFFGVITGTDQKKQDRNLYRDTEGSCDMKMWLLNVRDEKAILSAKVFTGRSGGARLSLDTKGSDRQVQATANALRDGLKDFFVDYPKIGKS
ncbi:MAG: hypothetical protein HONBIEJF_00295 [Fimbriimonadaceae bacterium]|nr:hypothetical protein [Fimbriimonadaceae bacterium]